MRIISGNLKSRVIKGNIPDFIRPTTDKVRESIFNILGNYIDFDDLNVADICAGTGMMGFESISRGCGNCSFVDKDSQSIRFINSLAESFRISKDKYSVHKNDALKFLEQTIKNFPEHKFDLIFTDPPYKANFLNQMVRIIYDGNLLNSGGFFVAEHDNTEIILVPMDWKRIVDKSYGLTKIEIFMNNID
ncbi:MAG: 16S rRNA (guanine(966)-N(2))-methyltransferase RsmD [Ignavibacteriae bacterium]|nr:16S rRNA (guanine(966)-N(2))-methyltransferase RsmD [Ignavibacteriota bacterium]